VLMLCSEIDG